jgi:hypothetical protein
VVNEQRGSGDTSEAAAYDGVSSGSLKLALPNVTRRYFGYDTPVIVQDLGAAPANAVATFVSFDETQTLTIPLSIAPGRSAVIDPNFTPGLVDGTQYAVTITSDQPITAVVNPVRLDGGPGVASAYNAFASGANQLWAPYFAKNAPAPAGTSPVVVENMGLAETTPQVKVTVLPPGTLTPKTYRYTGPPLAPGTSWVLDPRFQACDFCAPGTPVDLPDGSIGDIKIVTLLHGAVGPDPAGQIAAVVLPTSDTTAMAYQARPPTTSAFLPNVTRRLGGDDGWTTPIRLSGNDAPTTVVTVQWFRFSDGALVLTQQVGMGTYCCGETGVTRENAVTIDPRSVAGLTDDTQYSVVVTATNADGRGVNPFSVVVTELATGADNAMAYEGFPGPTPSPTPTPTATPSSTPTPTPTPTPTAR